MFCHQQERQAPRAGDPRWGGQKVGCPRDGEPTGTGASALPPLWCIPYAPPPLPSHTARPRQARRPAHVQSIFLLGRCLALGFPLRPSYLPAYPIRTVSFQHRSPRPRTVARSHDTLRTPGCNVPFRHRWEDLRTGVIPFRESPYRGRDTPASAEMSMGYGSTDIADRGLGLPNLGA